MARVKNITKTCIACPTQWEGTLEDGRMIYVRYRWENITVTVSSEPTEDIYDAVEGKVLFTSEYGGDMDFDDLKNLTKHILDWRDVYEQE